MSKIKTLLRKNFVFSQSSNIKIIIIANIILTILVFIGLGILWRLEQTHLANAVDIKKALPGADLDNLMDQYSFEFDAVVKSADFPGFVIEANGNQFKITANQDLHCLAIPYNYKEIQDIMELIYNSHKLECQDIQINKQYKIQAVKKQDNKFYMINLYELIY